MKTDMLIYTRNSIFPRFLQQVYSYGFFTKIYIIPTKANPNSCQKHRYKDLFAIQSLQVPAPEHLITATSVADIIYTVEPAFYEAFLFGVPIHYTVTMLRT